MEELRVEDVEVIVRCSGIVTYVYKRERWDEQVDDRAPAFNSVWRTLDRMELLWTE